MSLAARIRGRLEKYEARAKKRLGQNFLIDEQLRDRIADVACEGASRVLEIGPGPGSLTEALLTRAEVVAVEKDPVMVRLLAEELPDAEVIEGDILKTDVAFVANGAHVAGNIPYNLSAPILFLLLRSRAHIGPTTLMLQREVAERIVAKPETKAYGSLSVMLQMHADIERIAKVSPGAFMPAPKVHSTVLRFRWLEAPRFAVPSAFEEVVRAAFGQRRKMLRNSLRTGFDDLSRSPIDLTRRAETLSLAEFAELARALVPSK